jgi:4-amino-4-deoxy-L-arabinose transferase-like glycosyltransferase
MQPERHKETPLGRLVARHGKVALVILAVIVAVGFGLRLDKVVNPHSNPGADALAYRALAESLYEEGSYGANFRDPTDWSPGAPLLFAAGHHLSGGVNDGFARGLQALLGTAAILLIYLIALRLAGPGAVPLLAAAFVAVYPPFIHSVGSLMSEPVAIFLLPATILAFLWADQQRAAAWLLPGLLMGLTALVRPEYLFVALVLLVLVAARRTYLSGAWQGLACSGLFLLAAVLAIAPWTVRNHQELGRFVPITTGSGKALFVGTNLPADGEYQRLKAILNEKSTGEYLEPGSPELAKVDPVPLFDAEAAAFPELERDQALGRLGRENFFRYLEADPLGYAAMTVRKVARMWGSGVGQAFSSLPGQVVQILLVLAGLAGALILVSRRRWEILPLGTPIVVVTAIASITLAPPRRNEILMTLVLPLAALAVVALYRVIAERLAGGDRPPENTMEPAK